MENQRKRPLLPKGCAPNKYSSANNKKRALTARPPPPASVTRLESLLDGQIKKKKKANDSLKANAKTKTTQKQTATAAGQRRRSDENIRNGSSMRNNDSNHDRWSHVSSGTTDRRKPAVNPFLEVKRKEIAKSQKKAAADKKKSTADLFLSEADGVRKKVKSTNKSTLGGKKKSTGIYEKSSILSTIISSKPPSSRIHLEEMNHVPTDKPKESIFYTKESVTSAPNVPKPSSETTLSRIERESTPCTVTEAPRSSKEPIAVAVRPKLGLRISNPAMKNKWPSALSSASMILPVQSIPNTAGASEDAAVSETLPITDQDKGNCSPEELPRVLRSPTKSGTSQTDSSDNHANTKSLLTTGTTADRRSTNSAMGGLKKKTMTKKNSVNDNFVRLNMKNNAGACRGARNKSSKFSKERRSWTFRGGPRDNFDDSMGIPKPPVLTFDAPLPPTSSTRTVTNDVQDEHENDAYRKSRVPSGSKSNATSYVSKMSGLDPLDEFVDGTFHGSGEKSHGKTTASTPATSVGSPISDVPKCARHQRPCKKIKVKKATTGNKGREFYACSMPRGEQCDHFQWADDTVEAARSTIAKNTSYSSFITRQVAAYVDRFRTLTVPELKLETARRGLNKNGKKEQLLMRLAIWTRDELVKCSPESVNEDNEAENATGSDNETTKKSIAISEEESDDDDSSSCSEDSSEDELELFNEEKESDDEEDNIDEDEACPFTNTTENRTDDESSLSSSLREIFGHTSFRKGQEWAVQRCLDEKKSLLVAPTGFGKSLCYALPAALMHGVCIVVSPLISLIQDQLRSLPPRVPAATLSGSVSASKTAAILDDIVRKRLKILFVSPERLTSPAFRRLFNLTWNPETKIKERKFPEISLLCIDEAHCISQWAHNFRPCFLRFKGFLKVMQPKSVLAITATAGPRVINDIAQTLGMDLPESVTEESTAVDSEHDGIKIIRTGRDNIDVMGKFMSNQEERLSVVAGILTPDTSKRSDKKQPYAGKLAKGSVIVYVWRQKDTEVVAESLIGAGVSGGVVVYHGGMDANARAKSQNKFMRGKARICVATVAFGLGIDKADIVGIIHLYLSNSPEHYLQEIGRAGRDGRSASAIALPLLEEVPTRHSLVFSNLVAKTQIRSLLRIIKRLVESAGKVADTGDFGDGRVVHVALPVQSTVRACDCKPETIETFLSLIERIGGDDPILQIEGYNYDSATIALKKRTLKKLAEREPIAVSIQAVSQCIDAPLSGPGVEEQKVERADIPKSFQRGFLAYSKGSHSFSISQCANRLGPTAEPRHVFAALRRLQSSNELEFVLDTSEMGRIFHLKISKTGFETFIGDGYVEMEGNLVDTIFESFSSSSTSGATKVLDMHYILDQVACASTPDEDDDEIMSSYDKSPSLVRFQELTANYFGQGLEEERVATEDLLPASFSKIREKELKIDALSLLRDLPPLFQQHKQKDPLPEYVDLGGPSLTDYTALAITKFLHGMDTPRTPMWTFWQYPMFGKWKEVNFRLVHEMILNVFESRTEKSEARERNTQLALLPRLHP